MKLKLLLKTTSLLRLIKVGKRLFVFLVVIFTIAVFTIGFILYKTSKDIVLSKTDQHLTDYVHILQTNTDDYMHNQLNCLNEILTNVGLINSVRNYDTSKPETCISALSVINSELFRASRNISGFIGFDICTTSELITHLQYHVTTGNIDTSEILQKTLSSPERIELFGTIPLEDPGTDYKYALENGKGVVIGTKINNHTNGQKVGLGILAFSESSLYDAILKRTTTVNDEVYITNQDGTIISKKDKKLLGHNDVSSVTGMIDEIESKSTGNIKANNFKMKIGNTNFLVYYAVSQTTGWRIISLTNYDNLIAEINRNYVVSLIFLGVITSIVFIFSTLVTKSITVPLNEITQAIRKTSIENKYPVVNATGSDEISYLGKTFNSMSKRIQDLIAEIQEVHKKERQAEFIALQSQINPHFLYNTLDSVNWLAYMSDNLDICEIVNSLSKFFRLSLNKGNDFYTIADEVEHVKSYISILKIKHRKSINFFIDVDDECLKYKTIKILLQPLVENSVYHGIEPKGGMGNVNIKIFRHNNTITLDVIDDGIGINNKAQKVIEKSFKGNNDREGYGIANIDERIKLFFGNDYGLSIESNKPCGTKVTLIIPVIEQ